MLYGWIQVILSSIQFPCKAERVASSIQPSSHIDHAQMKAGLETYLCTAYQINLKDGFLNATISSFYENLHQVWRSSCSKHSGNLTDKLNYRWTIQNIEIKMQETLQSCTMHVWYRELCVTDSHQSEWKLWSWLTVKPVCSWWFSVSFYSRCKREITHA